MKTRLTLLALFIVMLGQIPLKAAKPYNILFLFSDDHAYDAIGLMSDGYVQTPTMDQLAAEGVYFEHAYNMGAWRGAVCVASRSMLNAGKSLWNAKRLFEGKPFSTDDFWSKRMQRAGYTTFFAGKWHVKGYDVEPLFDQCGMLTPGMAKTYGDHNRPIEGKPDTWSASDPKFEGYWKDGKHLSEITADDAIEFLKQVGSTHGGKPFFAYVAFNAPHDPRQSPQEYLDLYPVESVPLPKSFMPSYPYAKQIGCWNVRAESMAPRPRTEFAIKTHRREYYALISHLDTQLGRIIDELKKQGLYDNTIIIYTADHGLSLGNHSFMAKQSMYDHSLSSPFIISGPQIPKGVRSKQRIYIQDVMPTTLELAGLSKSDYADVEYESLLPLGSDGSSGHTAPIYGAYKNLSRCIVQEPWKLIYYPQADKFRLYHLEKDPNELSDVSDNPENKSIMQKMKTLLVKQQQQFGDDQVEIPGLGK